MRELDAPIAVLTHCNAGALATAGDGTALAVLRRGWEAGLVAEVFAGETRPLLQGARLTAYELMADRIPVTLITDNMAAWLMGQGQIGAVITGADRIAANGDAANKIGTYGLAVLARHHKIPFYIAAPFPPSISTPAAAIPCASKSVTAMRCAKSAASISRRGMFRCGTPLSM